MNEFDRLADWLDALLDARIDESERIEKATLKALNEWLLQLDTAESNGVRVIVSGSTVSSLFANARKQIEQSLAGNNLRRFTEEIIADFNAIVGNVEELHRLANGITMSANFQKTAITPIKRQIIREVADALSDSSIHANIIEPLTRVMFESVQFNYTILEAQERLAAQMNYSKYIGQIVRDSFFQFDGTVNNMVAERYELNGFRYVGSIVKDSRGQCRRWVEIGKIPRKALSKEIAWAKRSGEYKGKKKSGMNGATNEKNFATYRGGYNCRHRAIPVRMSEAELKRYEKRHLS